MRGGAVAALVVFALAGPARADTEWELTGAVGAGRFFGKGADTNRIGGSSALSGGPRFSQYLSFEAYFQVNYLRLRKVADLDDGNGESFVFALGPTYHPLGKRYAIQPFIGGLVGILYARSGTVEGDAEVEARSRAVAVGGTVGAVWAFDAHWAAGLSIVALPAFVDKSCIHIVGGPTSCEAQIDATNVLGTGNAVLKYTF